MMLILSSLLLISGFSITSTLVMTVLSDRHDIAIIRSLGFSRAHIRYLYIIKGVTLSLIGVFLGLVLGIGFSYYINPILSLLDSVLNTPLLPKQFYYLSQIPVQFKSSQFVFIIGFCSFVAIVSSLYPAHKAASIDVVEVLRHE